MRRAIQIDPTKTSSGHHWSHQLYWMNRDQLKSILSQNSWHNPMRCVLYIKFDKVQQKAHFRRYRVVLLCVWFICMLLSWSNQPKVVELSWSNQPSARGMSGDATRKLCRPCLHTLHTCSSVPCSIYWPPIHDHGQTHRSACEKHSSHDLALFGGYWKSDSA